MRQDPLIPSIGVVTKIRVDTPDVKTFSVVGLDGKKPLLGKYPIWKLEEQEGNHKFL